ncbi:MAG: formylglycine-generating enzyme family protein [Cyanobacteriota bacterium]
MASPKAATAKPSAENWRVLRWSGRQLAYRERLAEEVSLTLLRIPSGSFWRGAPKDEEGSSDAEGPVHRVQLGDFLLGQTPVTQAQWRAVAGWRREEHEEEAQWPRKLDPDPVVRYGAKRYRGEQRPVVGVTWMEAMAFCQRLRLRTGKNYTLPSEAQWEYACRAGSTTAFHFGATISPKLANYNGGRAYGDGPTGEHRQQTTPVGVFPANAWGLQDMHGNVWEWCADHWHDSYAEAPADGRPWLDENASEDAPRLLRGGSWFSGPGGCRSAYRFRVRPDGHDGDGGFRVCCLPEDVLFYL